MPKKVKIIIICIAIWMAIAALLATCSKVNNTVINQNYETLYRQELIIVDLSKN